MVEPSQVGESRRFAVSLADALGFDEIKCSEIAIVVTELATNLVKHTTKGGGIITQVGVTDGSPEIEILALDRGPGIPSLTSALSDGFSTAGSLGTGLGAVSRLSNAFEIYSEPGKGTAILSRHSKDRAHKRSTMAMPPIGGVSVPLRGEQVCGDAWIWLSDITQHLVLVADGLGHGTYAAEAANEALDVVAESGISAPSSVLTTVHSRLRATRGAAVSVALMRQQALSFAGLGNVTGAICSPERRQQLTSHDGTAGFEARRIRQYEYELPFPSLVVIHSDGCSRKWDLQNYPGLMQKSASLIAGVLFRDSAKGTDDATIVVFKTAQYGPYKRQSP